MNMSNARKASDGRSIGLLLAALAALGWGAAFFALFQTFETRSSAGNTISELEDENARLAALVDASGELSAIESQITQADQALVATLERRRDLEENIATLHAELLALGSAPSPAVTGSMQDADRTQDRASSVNAALVRLDQTIAERSSDLAGLNHARLDAEARLQAALETAAEIDRRMTARAQELAAAEQRLSALLADNARLDHLNARRSAELAKLADEEKRALRQIELAEAEFEELTQRRAGLGEEVERLEASIAKNAMASTEIAEQQARLVSLREEVTREDARLGQTRRQLADLQAQIQTSQAELRRLRNAVQPSQRTRPPVEDRPDGSRVIRVRPSFN